MKYSILSAAVIAALALSACEKTVVTPPASTTPPAVVTVPGPKETVTKETVIQPAPTPPVVVAPGPAGPPGAPGAEGPKGDPGRPGRPGGDTVVIVPPPEKR